MATYQIGEVAKLTGLLGSLRATDYSRNAGLGSSTRETTLDVNRP